MLRIACSQWSVDVLHYALTKTEPGNIVGKTSHGATEWLAGELLLPRSLTLSSPIVEQQHQSLIANQCRPTG